jgi:hypothetical protein
VIHDPDLVGQAGGLVHVVRGQEQRHPAFAQLPEPVPHEQPRGGVEPGGRLVEKQHLGLVHQRPGDHHALGLAAREQVGLDVAALAQSKLLEQLVGAGLGHRGRNAVIRGVARTPAPLAPRTRSRRPRSSATSGSA